MHVVAEAYHFVINHDDVILGHLVGDDAIIFDEKLLMSCAVLSCQYILDQLRIFIEFVKDSFSILSV